MVSQKKQNSFVCLLLAASFSCGFIFTGCQVSVGGQTLPSAYFLDDDVEYYTKGPEFKLAKEAAALKEARAAESANR
jgi:hypothetical protein